VECDWNTLARSQEDAEKTRLKIRSRPLVLFSPQRFLEYHPGDDSAAEARVTGRGPYTGIQEQG